MNRFLVPTFLLTAALSALAPYPSEAQPPTDLLLPPQASAAAPRGKATARRARKARVDSTALSGSDIRLQLFDDLQVELTRKKIDRPASNKLVWVGENADGAQGVLTVSDGVLTGTVFADHRAFEITIEPDGDYAVAELDSAAFPTDDPVAGGLEAAAGDAASAAAVPAANELGSGTVQMDIMVVWTAAAEAAGGGRAAMESLALNAVANSNAVYVNSRVNAQMRLVYAGLANFAENPSNISDDLAALQGGSDGRFDNVHSLRTQYGADIVTLLGEGYRGAGTCGIGYVMTSLSASMAPYAFDIVDRSCALANLSFPHEVGHNQGLQHDPGNAGGQGVTSYAYGYQDPSGYFRTIMAYGSSLRIPYLSNPGVAYNGRPTGTTGQDNARSLNASAATIAAFRSPSGTSSGPTPPPEPNSPTTCDYSVSTSSLSFQTSGGSKSVSVTAPAGCGWSASSAASWVALNADGGSGSGSITVSVGANTSAERTATVTVAGRTISVSQSGATVKRRGRNK